jgi:predicted RNA binding protein YcfA (HicA-like mRNA interferase family)
VTDHLTFETLQATLSKLGFIKGPAPSGHALFEHPASGTKIILGAHLPGEPLSQLDLARVRRPLIENGFMDAREFERLVSKKSA